jgi:pterin-4a-carbinolamine dehydratase
LAVSTLQGADRHTPHAEALDERQLRRALAQRQQWRLRDGALVRELLVRDFDEALRLLEHVAECAVDYARRPDMCISEFNHVRLSISNPHHAGLTVAELRLAGRVDEILEEHHPEVTAGA